MTNEGLAGTLVMGYGMKEIILLVKGDTDFVSLHFYRFTKPDWGMENVNADAVKQNFDAVILQCTLSFGKIAPELQQFKYKNYAKEKSIRLLERHHSDYVLFLKEQFSNYFNWLGRPYLMDEAVEYFLTIIISLSLTKKFDQCYRALLKKIESYSSQRDLPEFLQLEVEKIKLGELKPAFERKVIYSRFI
ncbi:MAG: hypothetical protein JNL24_09165 [Bacteroidia bacterium]|nr:hypothetical protein [Bacteroidia bacterium]